MKSPFFTKTFRQFFIYYFLIILGFTLIALAFGSTIYSEISFYASKILRTNYVLVEDSSAKEGSTKNVFSALITGQEVNIKPATKDSIVIEKIGVSAPVIKNVSVLNEDAYFNALKKGVAHAQGKAYFGEVGNVYLFAHSSIEFWKMGPYATVFNQIRRLENGDIIHTYSNGVRYDYVVFDKQVVQGFDTSPYEANYSTSVLTLQTCDPPGTQLNRLIVRARLVN
jgi:LPXTG-site transpeptidase (sortase) family protein